MSLASVSKGCRLPAGPVHLLIHSTGLKVYGAGEWLQEKHGARARRTHVELDLRNLKTTTAMDVLSCQTPQMNEKQLWVHLLAYNVIRLLMAQAASNAGVNPPELSFKHAVQLWTEWVSRGVSATKDDGHLFALIAQCRVANRPGRIEPRMRKRRPKSYPWLKIPHAQDRRKIERHGRAWETK